MGHSSSDTGHAQSEDSHFYLPDFCNVRVIFAVVVTAQLMAFILALSPLTDDSGRWASLNLISLLVQWIALTSVAVLCVSRPLLARFGTTAASTASYVLVLAVAGLVSEAAFWLTRKISLGIHIPDALHGEFLLRNIVISAIISAAALRYFFVQHQLKRNIAAEARARLDALQARIRPHFLFNSMNTIASLTRTSPALAESAIEDLSDLFRVSLSDGRKLVPLSEEIELVKRYLSIESLRLGDRLKVDWKVDASVADVPTPALLLQPLVENAIYHGIEPEPAGGTISVTAEACGKAIRITVTNPLPRRDNRRHAGNRIALDNIRQRLGAHFGGRGTLEVKQEGPSHVVEVTLPRRSNDAHSNS